MIIYKLNSYLSSNPRTVFLIDGIGAVLSTMLLLVVGYFEDAFGMQKEVLHRLVPITILFSIYSLACYSLKPQNWKRYLDLIAIANFLYCFITVGLIVHYFNQLTPLGVIYFLIEIVVILILCRIEWRMAA